VFAKLYTHLALRAQAQEQGFHFAARPGVPAQEGEAALQARVVSEAADANEAAELFPAVAGVQLLDDLLQGDAVQRILGVSSRRFRRWRGGGRSLFLFFTGLRHVGQRSARRAPKRLLCGTSPA